MRQPVISERLFDADFDMNAFYGPPMDAGFQKHLELPPLGQQTRLQTLFKPGCTRASTAHCGVEKLEKPIET